jgi:hypothetical protein
MAYYIYMCMDLLFSLINSWQVPFIHVIIIKTFILQYGHLSDIKCELKIMNLLEFVYIVIPIHLQRRIQKGFKKWKKIIIDKTSKKKGIAEWKPKLFKIIPNEKILLDAPEK